MWWQVIINDAGLISVGVVVGTLFGFMLCALLFSNRDRERQAQIMQMAEDVRRDA